MHSEHELYFGLDMDARATVYSRNTNVIMITVVRLGMDALATACTQSTNVMMVWAWMHWRPIALGTQTLLWFGHGCTGDSMNLEHQRYDGLGIGCTGDRVHSEHRRYYSLGIRCTGDRTHSQHKQVIMIWASDAGTHG